MCRSPFQPHEPPPPSPPWSHTTTLVAVASSEKGRSSGAAVAGAVTFCGAPPEETCGRSEERWSGRSLGWGLLLVATNERYIFIPSPCVLEWITGRKPPPLFYFHFQLHINVVHSCVRGCRVASMFLKINQKLYNGSYEITTSYVLYCIVVALVKERCENHVIGCPWSDYTAIGPTIKFLMV